jgi:colanic acid biosynthesis glycosyl transferase WcaI
MATKGKILIHSIAFSPDGVSTAYLYNDIAKSFKKNGFEVVVLTTTPHYNVVKEEVVKQPLTKHAFGFYYTSEIEGIKVVHVYQKKYKSTILRLIGFLFWHLMSFILGLKEKNIKAILSPSPPLTIGLINLLIGKIKGAKVVYNVQEIYPDFLIEQGRLKSKIIIRILKWLECYVYNKSDAVTTIDQVFYNTIVPRFEQENKLKIIPNFVDTQLYKPIEVEDIKLDPNLFKTNANLKVMYAGNIGHAQDWEPLIQTAIALKGESIEFYIIGEGVMKSYVQDQIIANSLTNVQLLPYQPRALMPQLLAFSDLQFIFMSKDMEGHGFPSKVYTIMACGKPLIVCSGQGTPIINFLKESDCSKLITTQRLDEKTQEIIAFLESVTKEELHVMGNNGLAIVQNTYTKEVVTREYVALINALI